MNKIVSFIIPAYNAENFLAKCLDSLLVDKCLKDIEIIVVNDGSTDSTKNIAQKYQENFQYCITIINKENGGHGSAINYGVKKASGKYFRVLDSDDWIVSENLEQQITILKETNSDVIINNFHSYDIITQIYRLYSVDCEYCLQEISMDELINVYSSLARNCSFHGISYNTEFYRKLNLLLTEKIFYDDNEFAIIPMLSAKSIKLIPISFYQYRIGDVNQSVAFPNQVKRIGNIEMVIKSIISNYKSLEIESASNTEYYLRQLSQLVVSYFAVALVKNQNKKDGRKIAKKMISYLEINERRILKRTSKKYSIMLFLNRMHLSQRLYQKLLDSKLYQFFLIKWIG